MHCLHRILIKIEPDPNDREYVIDHARSVAEQVTDCFENDVFDWRETDTAGRWSDDYPVNVLLAVDDVDRFIKEIEECRKLQRDTMEEHLRNMEPYGYDIKNLVNESKGKASRPAWDILEIAKLLYGEYMFDSYFYDTDRYTSRIYDETIDEIKHEPENWALVMFDYHY